MSVRKFIYVIYGVKTTFDFVESLDLEYDAAEEITVTDNMSGDYAYIGVPLFDLDLDDLEEVEESYSFNPNILPKYRSLFFKQYADLLVEHPKLNELLLGEWKLHTFVHYC